MKILELLSSVGISPKHKNILDFSCGDGEVSKCLTLLATSLILCDLQDLRIDKTSNFFLLNPYWYCGKQELTQEKIPLFDIIIIRQALNYLSPFYPPLFIFQKYLKFGGHIIFNIPNTLPVQSPFVEVKQYQLDNHLYQGYSFSTKSYYSLPMIHHTQTVDKELKHTNEFWFYDSIELERYCIQWFGLGNVFRKRDGKTDIFCCRNTKKNSEKGSTQLFLNLRKR